MAFLDTFGPAHRALFDSVAQQVPLAKGELLMRRGDASGDLYLVVAGTLEVVDNRSMPEIILSTIGPGSVVGEMAFVDDSPRSADVRAGTEVSVMRWARDDLRSLLTRYPDLAVAFYATLARLATSRVRFLTEGAVAQAFGKEDAIADIDQLSSWVDAIAERVKVPLPPAESALRRDPDDASAKQTVRDVLDRLEADVEALFDAVRDPTAAQYASEHLSRELHPYLVRSRLAERSVRRQQGVVGSAEVLAHILVDMAGGDGRLGEVIDRWLLDRPLCKGLRTLRDPVVTALQRHLPQHRSRSVLLVNAGTGSLVARAVELLAEPPTVLTVLDQSRDSLALIDVTRADRPLGVEVHTLQENLPRFAVGRGRFELPQQDGIVLHGLLEYLPERMAVSLLGVCRSLLTDEGVIVLATVGPSNDRALLDRLLDWPMLRRTPERIEALIKAAGLAIVGQPELPAPAVLLALAPDDRTTVPPFA